MGRIKKSSLKEGHKWCSRFDVHRKTRAVSDHVAAREGNRSSISGHRDSRCCRWGDQYYTVDKASKISDLNPYGSCITQQ